MPPVKLFSVGAGSRGTTYATYALEHPEHAAVVGVAEPRSFHRDRIASQHAVDADFVFEDWRDALNVPRFADVAVLELSSPGGDAYAAMAMVPTIRAAGLATRIGAGDKCHSACSFLYFAGVERTAE